MAVRITDLPPYTISYAASSDVLPIVSVAGAGGIGLSEQISMYTLAQVLTGLFGFNFVTYRSPEPSDLYTNLNVLSAAIVALIPKIPAPTTYANLSAAIFYATYPVGAIYCSTVNVTPPSPAQPFDPVTAIWTPYAQGRVMVGISTTDTNFKTAGQTGGADTVALTLAQTPSHRHKDPYSENGGQPFGEVPNTYGSAGSNSTDYDQGLGWTSYVGGEGGNDTNAGTTQAHNNLQPYITVYAWTRTA